MEVISAILFLFALSNVGESANILYVVPFASKSHYIMLKPIGLELARRGHNVTVIATHKDTNPPPNYRQIIIDQKEIWEIAGGKRPNVFTMVDISAEKLHQIILWGGGLGVTEVALNTTDVQKFLAEDNHFDLVISEQFFQEALYVLAHKYHSPLVLVTTFGNCMRHNVVTRNPLQLATVVSEFLDLKDPTSLWSRMRNLYFTVYEYVGWKYWYLEQQEQLVKKYIHNLPQPVPSLYDLQRNASLILLNSHFSVDTPAAYLPNAIEIGGLHLSESDGKLPEDLQKLLDDAVHGVVYVNFGSNVRSSELPTEKKNAFLNVFRKLKQTVLWKWEDNSLQNIPKNLVAREWFPQKEILSHPNVKVFISHGGLIGTQEAIYYGVPIIGMPIYADQYNNLLQVEQHGFGRILEYKDIDETNLHKIINNVLKNNESYRNKAKEVSTRFKDRPLSALDTAVFWIEYVIRNKGANFMKNPARDLSWMAYNMLDVYLMILFITASSIYLVFNIVKILAKIFIADPKVNKKKRA